MKRTLRARVVGSVSAVALAGGIVAGLTVGAGGGASAVGRRRATFHAGNVTNCAETGFPEHDPGRRRNGASDANVSGVVKTNVGSRSPAGQEVDITCCTAASRSRPSSSRAAPPTTCTRTRRFSAGARSRPALHLAAQPRAATCRRSATGSSATRSSAPEAGSLAVTKVVLPPDGTPVTPLPTATPPR